MAPQTPPPQQHQGQHQHEHSACATAQRKRKREEERGKEEESAVWAKRPAVCQGKRAASAAQRVFGDDLGPLILAHVRGFADRLALAQCVRSCREIVHATTVAEQRSLTIQGVLDGGGRSWGADVVHWPFADLSSVFSVLSFRSLVVLELLCTPRMFVGFAGSAPPAPSTECCFPPLESLMLRLQLRDCFAGMAHEALPVAGLAAFPGVRGFVERATRTLGHLAIRGLDFALSEEWLADLPALTNLRVLEIGEVHALPPTPDLVRVLDHNLPLLHSLDLERFDPENRCDDHVFGTTLARALHESAVGSTLAELTVVGAWLDLHLTTALLPALINLTWHNALRDAPRDPSLRSVLALCDADPRQSPRLPPHEPSELLSVRLIGKDAHALRSSASMAQLAATCPVLSHLHVEDVHIDPLPADADADAGGGPGGPGCGSGWSLAALLRGAADLSNLQELEVGVLWAEGWLSPQAEVAMARDVARQVVDLCMEAPLQSVTLLLQTMDLPEKCFRVVSLIQKHVRRALAHDDADVRFECRVMT